MVWWVTALKAVGTIASVVKSAKSRPEKSEMEKISGLTAFNVKKGTQQVLRHGQWQDKINNLMVDHINSAGVKNYLTGLQRADTAQSAGELSYAKAKDVKGEVASTKVEAELGSEVAAAAKEADIGKTLGFLNSLAGVSNVQYQSTQALAASQSSYLANKYEQQTMRKGIKWGGLAGASSYFGFGNDPFNIDPSRNDQFTMPTSGSSGSSGSGSSGGGVS